MAETVGFIGLGALGAPVAANLLDAGYGLRVHNRTRAKADPLLARGAEWAERPADAAPPGGIVATLLWDDASVEGVVRSESFLERLGDGVHISMSLISPHGSRALAALHARHGSQLVEAPIFGVVAAAGRVHAAEHARERRASWLRRGQAAQGLQGAHGGGHAGPLARPASRDAGTSAASIMPINHRDLPRADLNLLVALDACWRWQPSVELGHASTTHCPATAGDDHGPTARNRWDRGREDF